jgi:predicted enzyme related to lactoylglutathione lyase
MSKPCSRIFPCGKKRESMSDPIIEPVLTIKGIKGVAIPVVNEERAKHFYGEVLKLPVADGEKEPGGYRIGNAFLMLKPEWHAAPSDDPIPRITIEITGARAAEQALLACGVEMPDPVTREGHAYFGSFLDSEGNKLWFCSFD